MGITDSTKKIRGLVTSILAECDALDALTPTPPPKPDPPPTPDPPTPPTPGLDAGTGLPFPLTPRSRAKVMTGPLVVTSNLTLTESLAFPRDGLCIAKEGVTIDLNGHTIHYAGAGPGFGVRLYTIWLGEDQRRFGRVSGASQYAHNVTIKNGAIVCGSTDYGDCHGVSSEQADGVVIENCYILAAGVDAPSLGDTDGTFTVCLRWGTNTQIKNCTLVAVQKQPVDRHLIPANVRLGSQSYLADSRLLGGNSGVKFTGQCQILRNLICHDAYVANGCGVIIGSGCNDSLVADNLILPGSGHGLFLAGDPQRNRLERNLALCRGIPHAEFQAAGPPMGGLRIRDYPGGNTISGNFLLAISGERYERSAALTCIQRTPKAGQTPNKITGNILAAARIGPYLQTDPISGNTVACYSRALGFEQPESGQAQIRDEINDNELWGNDVVIGLSGFDGSCNQRAPLTGNRLALLDGSEMAARFAARVRAWLAGNQRGNPVTLARAEQALAGLTDELGRAPRTAEARLFQSGMNAGEYLAYAGPELATTDVRNMGAGALRVIDGDGWRLELVGGTIQKIAG